MSGLCNEAGDGSFTTGESTEGEAGSVVVRWVEVYEFGKNHLF